MSLTCRRHEAPDSSASPMFPPPMIRFSPCGKHCRRRVRDALPSVLRRRHHRELAALHDDVAFTVVDDVVLVRPVLADLDCRQGTHHAQPPIGRPRTRYAVSCTVAPSRTGRPRTSPAPTRRRTTARARLEPHLRPPQYSITGGPPSDPSAAPSWSRRPDATAVREMNDVRHRVARPDRLQPGGGSGCISGMTGLTDNSGAT